MKHARGKTKGIMAGCFARLGLVLLCLAGAPRGFAAPVPGGTLDPLSIPKYVAPLVIPPVMPTNGMPDSYDIAVRQFKQQILPAPLPATTIWSYGAAADPTPAIAPAPGSSFNYPAFTVETVSNMPVRVRWINDLKDPTTGLFLPHLLPIDQSLHWANPAKATICKMTGLPGTDCATNDPTPYLGPVPIVTHVHGAHVDPHSDGYPEAWWLPAGVSSDYESKGSLFDDATGINPGNTGYADYLYRNDQPATTLWYHDHTLGMTRANVYAGPAGFWLIRGGGFDQAKDLGSGKKAVLPGPAPVAGNSLAALNTPGDPLRSGIREIPIVIQDRSFHENGELFYPATREFFDGFTGPYTPDFVQGGQMSDISPAWNPEAFFNVMVVNGVSWPKLDVAPARYRLRLLNGCNSRFLNLALRVVNPDGSLGQELPFYQIGADQGFLPQVVRIKTGEATPLPSLATVFAPDPDQALLMGLAERADVIVDFSGLADGTVVRMINTAADAPFGGFDGAEGEEEMADPDTTGQVMQFVVGSALLLPSDAMTTPPEKLVLKAEKSLDNRNIKMTRQISLNEGESETVCLDSQGEPVPPFAEDCHELVAPKEALLGTVSGGGMSAVGIPLKWTDRSGVSTPVQVTLADGVTTRMINVTENPTLGHTENWEIYNFTEDAHPIHLHLVRFQVVKRTLMDGLTASPNGSQQPWEAGFKDTVIAYPGEITTVRAKFDIAGLFVWHCHILEHEDNEMMRPYVVSP